MASTTDRIKSVRAVRQLRRVRTFYMVAVLLWAASTAWTGWQSPGSRPMWVSVLLLAVFTGLLLTASLAPASPGRGPGRAGAPCCIPAGGSAGPAHA